MKTDYRGREFSEELHESENGVPILNMDGTLKIRSEAKERNEWNQVGFRRGRSGVGAEAEPEAGGIILSDEEPCGKPLWKKIVGGIGIALTVAGVFVGIRRS